MAGCVRRRAGAIFRSPHHRGHVQQRHGRYGRLVRDHQFRADAGVPLRVDSGRQQLRVRELGRAQRRDEPRGGRIGPLPGKRGGRRDRIVPRVLGRHRHGPDRLLQRKRPGPERFGRRTRAVRFRRHGGDAAGGVRRGDDRFDLLLRLRRQRQSGDQPEHGRHRQHAGTLYGQVTFTSADALGNVGSPGTAAALAIPEPATGALLGLGALGLFGHLRRGRRDRG